MELFVSDLDGTLLNSKREITKYSKCVLNKLIEEGMNFTIATARTPATAVEILDGLNLKLPVILMNGVVIYNTKEKNYIDIKEIDKTTVHKVIDEFKKYDVMPLIYGIKDNHLWVYHKEFEDACMYNFYKERANKPLKTFIKVIDYKIAIKESKVINFVSFGDYEKIKGIYNKIKDIEEITVYMYEDIYYKGSYLLEIHSSNASKAKAIKSVAKYIEKVKVITFGDNINDISMFKISDECYATENGLEDIKKIATKVIGNCESDGVAKFLEERFKK